MTENINKNVQINGNTRISGNQNILGNQVISGNLTVNKNINSQGNMTVNNAKLNNANINNLNLNTTQIDFNTKIYNHHYLSEVYNQSNYSGNIVFINYCGVIIRDILPENFCNENAFNGFPNLFKILKIKDTNLLPQNVIPTQAIITFYGSTYTPIPAPPNGGAVITQSDGLNNNCTNISENTYGNNIQYRLVPCFIFPDGYIKIDTSYIDIISSVIGDIFLTSNDHNSIPQIFPFYTGSIISINTSYTIGLNNIISNIDHTIINCYNPFSYNGTILGPSVIPNTTIDEQYMITNKGNLNLNIKNKFVKKTNNLSTLINTNIDKFNSKFVSKMLDIISNDNNLMTKFNTIIQNVNIINTNPTNNTNPSDNTNPTNPTNPTDNTNPTNPTDNTNVNPPDNVN